MKIYNEYTTDDVICDRPLFINEIGNLFPIKMKYYKEFLDYIKYVTYTKAQLKLPSDITLMEYLFLIISNSFIEKDRMPEIKAREKCVAEFENMFSLVTKNNVVFKGTDNFVFASENNENVITKNNYELFSYVVAKQNVIKEPKIYEDELTAKWMEKARKAKEKNSPDIGMGDIVVNISCATGKSYEDILNQNILQTYADYYMIQHIENHRTLMLFKTVDNKVPNSSFMDEIIKSIYQTNDEDLRVSNGAFNLLSQ